jgi:hypothetical protein
MSKSDTGALYAIKLARLLLMYCAISIAVRISEADYVERVYGRNEPPPSLWSVLLTIAAFILVFDALLLALLRALGDVSKSPTFGNPGFRRFVMLESAIYTAFVLTVGYWVMTLVAKKKYFNYKMDGLRALRAMKEIVMALVVPFSVTPIFFST